MGWVCKTCMIIVLETIKRKMLQWSWHVHLQWSWHVHLQPQLHTKYTYTLPTHASAGHQWTILIIRGHFWSYFSQWELLVATNVCTLCSTVACTSRCGECSSCLIVVVVNFGFDLNYCPFYGIPSFQLQLCAPRQLVKAKEYHSLVQCMEWRQNNLGILV